MVEDLKSVKKELRKRKIKEKVNEIKVKINHFYLEHEEEIKVLAPAALAGGALLTRELVRRSRIKADFKMKNCRHYDRRMDQYVWSKRALKASELKIMNRMYANGATKADALEALGLLKM